MRRPQVREPESIDTVGMVVTALSQKERQGRVSPRTQTPAPRPRRVPVRVGTAAGIVVLAVFAGTAPGSSPAVADRAVVGQSPVALSSATSWGPVDYSPTLPLTSSAEVGYRGVVDVYAQLPGAVAAGTGIVTGDGAVLTNAHVITGGTQVRVVILDPGGTTGARVSAVGRVIGADRRHDVAVLRLTDPTTGAAIIPPPASLGDSDDLRVSDPVEAVGNAYGSGSTGAAPRVSRGRVTELGATVSVTDDYTGRGSRAKGMIQIDGQVFPGDSGGPLLDQHGSVVGMDTAGGDHRGWAIPIDTVLSVAARHGWLTTPAASGPAPSGPPQAPDPAVNARLDLAPLPLDARLGLG